MTDTELQKFDAVLALVESYEAKDLEKRDAVKKIIGITGLSEADVYIDDYWRSVDVEDFVQSLVIERSKPEELSDEDVRSIVYEIRSTEDFRRMDYLITKHETAIELKFRKNSNLLGDKFHQLDDSAEQIMEWVYSDADSLIIL